jgi:iron complex transport system substrate-binding protein
VTQKRIKEVLRKWMTFMVRQAHHERHLHPAVRPEPVEGLQPRSLNFIYGIIFSLFACTMPTAAWAQVSVNDDAGHVVNLKAPATRIVTLAPFLTELVYAAGAGEQLAAVSSYSDFPTEAKLKPVIGDASAIDMERLIALKPDMVIAWKSGGHPADTERLIQYGIAVLTVEAASLKDIPRLLRTFGKLAGTAIKAEVAAKNFEQRLLALRQRYAANPTQKVFFEIWHSPLITISGKHFISEAMGICNGKNIFADVNTLVPTVGLESIYAANPQIIISSTSAGNDNAMQPWLRHRKLFAVKNKNIFALDPDLIQRQTPRLLDGVEQMCQLLQKTIQ